MDSEPILKKTLVTVGAMVGACVAFVGTVSLVAVLVTSHVVGTAGDTSAASGAGGSSASGNTPRPPRAAHTDAAPTPPSASASPLHATPRAHDTI